MIDITNYIGGYYSSELVVYGGLIALYILTTCLGMYVTSMVFLGLAIWKKRKLYYVIFSICLALAIIYFGLGYFCTKDISDALIVPFVVNLYPKL